MLSTKLVLKLNNQNNFWIFIWQLKITKTMNHLKVFLNVKVDKETQRLDQFYVISWLSFIR